MNYIRYTNKNEGIVQLGGGEATQEMIDDGWFEYDGEIPSSSTNLYTLVDGSLTPVEQEEISVPVDVQIKRYKTYLEDTDFKMLPDYVPKNGEDLDQIIAKRNEAREFIRNNTVVINYDMLDNRNISESPTSPVITGITNSEPDGV